MRGLKKQRHETKLAYVRSTTLLRQGGVVTKGVIHDTEYGGLV